LKIWPGADRAEKLHLALKENPRGRLLRITEDIAGRYNSIIIPATGLREFKKLLEEMIKPRTRCR